MVARADREAILVEERSQIGRVDTRVVEGAERRAVAAAARVRSVNSDAGDIAQPVKAGNGV